MDALVEFPMNSTPESSEIPFAVALVSPMSGPNVLIPFMKIKVWLSYHLVRHL